METKKTCMKVVITHYSSLLNIVPHLELKGLDQKMAAIRSWRQGENFFSEDYYMKKKILRNPQPEKFVVKDGEMQHKT